MANNIKRYKSKNHVTINNAIMKERDVSLKAKGLFALVMSLPDDWDFSIKGICAITKENYTAVNSAIHELIDAGYCRRQTVKENGKFVGCDYEFSEVKTGSPRLDFTHTGNPRVENLNGNNINSTINSPLNDNISSINTSDKKEDKSVSNDTPKVDSLFETFWEKYGYKKSKKPTISAWRKLNKEQKEAAIKGIEIYKEDCRRNQRQMKHPSTYLNQLTWEDDFTTDGMVNEQEKELPAGLSAEFWESCKVWFIKNTPRICGYITPDVYMSMKAQAKDGKQMTDIIRYIEDSGYSGDIAKKFTQLLETGEYKEGL